MSCDSRVIWPFPRSWSVSPIFNSGLTISSLRLTSRSGGFFWKFHLELWGHAIKLYFFILLATQKEQHNNRLQHKGEWIKPDKTEKCVLEGRMLLIYHYYVLGHWIHLVQYVFVNAKRKSQRFSGCCSSRKKCTQHVQDDDIRGFSTSKSRLVGTRQQRLHPCSSRNWEALCVLSSPRHRVHIIIVATA